MLIGAVISMLLLIRRASRPHVAFLGRIPGNRRYSDLERHPDNQHIPGLLIFRPESSLIHFSVDHVRDIVLDCVRETKPAPRTVLCDLSASPMVDLAGAEMLNGLDEEFRSMGARLQIVEARASAEPSKEGKR